MNRHKILDHKYKKPKKKGDELCAYIYDDMEECLLPKYMHYE